MGAIPDLSGLVFRSTAGLGAGTMQTRTWYKDQRVSAATAAAPVASRFTSFWQYDGNPSHGAAPTTVAAPTNATQGSLLHADPTGGRQLWMTYCCLQSNSIGTFTLYDRLLHIGNLSGTVTTAQTVGGTLTRYTGATESQGNEIWAEVYTQIGATGTTITASYSNSAGTSGRTTQATAFGNTGLREAQRLIQLPLAAGDNGVTAVASATVLATTGTAGAFGINIMRPLISLPIVQAGVGVSHNLLDYPIEIDAGACLFWAFQANTTTVPYLRATVQMVEA